MRRKDEEKRTILSVFNVLSQSEKRKNENEIFFYFDFFLNPKTYLTSRLFVWKDQIKFKCITNYLF